MTDTGQENHIQETHQFKASSKKVSAVYLKLKPRKKSFYQNGFSQSSKVVGKTMADKLLNIPNDDTHNNPFCRL